MSEIKFSVGGSLMGAHDSTFISDGENPLEAVARAAVDSISTDVEITAGGVTMHLAAWMNPDHWESNWREAGVEDVYEWAASL
jgi:hypothetical protein